MLCQADAVVVVDSDVHLSLLCTVGLGHVNLLVLYLKFRNWFPPFNLIMHVKSQKISLSGVLIAMYFVLSQVQKRSCPVSHHRCLEFLLLRNLVPLGNCITFFSE